MTGHQLVRKFVFKTDRDVELFMAFMKQNRRPMAKDGRFLQAVVSEYKATRSNEQNSFMWSEGLLKTISEQAMAHGRRLSDQGWNLVFKILFLPETNSKGMDKWFYPPNGEDRQLMMSTSDLNEPEMTLYLNQVAEYAIHDLGVALPANPRDL